MQTLEPLLKKTEKAALVFRALNNGFRQQLLNYLRQHPGSMVTKIYEALDWEQSVASQHLAVLRRAGIVKTERNGKAIFYSLDESRLQEIEQIADQLL